MENITYSSSVPYSFLPPPEELSSPWLLGALAIGGYCISIILSQIFGYKVPVFGVVTQLEPIVVSNFRFFRHAEDVLNEGYRAVSQMSIRESMGF